ncbi:hypothetical protein [Nostoc sp.]
MKTKDESDLGSSQQTTLYSEWLQNPELSDRELEVLRLMEVLKKCHHS